jgi:hypothetical protein
MKCDKPTQPSEHAAFCRAEIERRKLVTSVRDPYGMVFVRDANDL